MRKAMLLGVVAVLLTMTQPARAQFCPGVSPWVFDDVQASDPFCGYITWMAQNGITLGCQVIDANHRLYCPSANVSRAAMAAFMNRLGNVRVEAVGTGPGLTGGPITSTGTINLAATQLLPTTACSSGQIPQWNGSAWACANDANGGGTVTSVGSGTGLAGGPITSAGTLSIASGYQLPQGCTGGQVAKSNGSGGWTCAGDANSGGTVTSVATGAGLTGGPITASGTINLAATQLLPTVACANGQVPTWTVSQWTCATPGSFIGSIDLPNSTAAVGNINKPGGVFLHNYGTGNVFAGVNSGNFTTTGNANSGFGAFALTASTSGFSNTAVGFTALTNNTTGNNNTAVGTGAMGANTTGNLNTAIGQSALHNNTSGGNNSALGNAALVNNTTGDFNTAIGSATLLNNVSASNNTAVGSNALLGNTAGQYNAAVGSDALTTNSTGSFNVAVGAYALSANTTASANTGVGNAALASNTTGSSNTATGTGALFWNTTGGQNTANGRAALAANTTGQSNTAVGSNAMQNNATGQVNTAVGQGALFNSTGDANTAVGASSLQSNTGGGANVALGVQALFSNTAGNSNTAVGANALYFSTGSGNVALGAGAGASLTTGSNNVDIAHSGVAGEGNVIRIGTSGNQTRAFVAGIRGVTTANNDAVAVVIDSAGQLGTISSSARFKRDVADMGESTSRLMDLRPVTFRYKSQGESGSPNLHFGLIAEEVAKVYPGLVAMGKDGRPETVMYQFLAPMLLNEYQRQQRTIEAQSQLIDEQARHLARIERHREEQDTQIAELRRAVEVLMARTSPEGSIAMK